MKKPILILLLSILTYSCNSDDDASLNEDDYLIFGHFYGFCVGENCIETFKLTHDKLYEDSQDNYSHETFSFEVLGNDKFEQAKDLIDYFPTKLLSEKETTIGCPDCADGGGIYIEYSKDGIVKSWRIDQMKNNIPNYLHDFMDKVNEKISLINK
tara:strand:+ start:20682 stop:21146 length:465 start_codon:yes stop_codon:yes gene_type:complete